MEKWKRYSANSTSTLQSNLRLTQAWVTDAAEYIAPAYPDASGTDGEPRDSVRRR